MCYFNAVIFLTSGVGSVIAYSVISHVTITQGVLNTEKSCMQFKSWDFMDIHRLKILYKAYLH